MCRRGWTSDLVDETKPTRGREHGRVRYHNSSPRSDDSPSVSTVSVGGTPHYPFPGPSPVLTDDGGSVPSSPHILFPTFPSSSVAWPDRTVLPSRLPSPSLSGPTLDCGRRRTHLSST